MLGYNSLLVTARYDLLREVCDLPNSEILGLWNLVHLQFELRNNPRLYSQVKTVTYLLWDHVSLIPLSLSYPHLSGIIYSCVHKISVYWLTTEILADLPTSFALLLNCFAISFIILFHGDNLSWELQITHIQS